MNKIILLLSAAFISLALATEDNDVNNEAWDTEKLQRMLEGSSAPLDENSFASRWLYFAAGAQRCSNTTVTSFLQESAKLNVKLSVVNELYAKLNEYQQPLTTASLEYLGRHKELSTPEALKAAKDIIAGTQALHSESIEAVLNSKEMFHNIDEDKRQRKVTRFISVQSNGKLLRFGAVFSPKPDSVRFVPVDPVGGVDNSFPLVDPAQMLVIEKEREALVDAGKEMAMLEEIAKRITLKKEIEKLALELKSQMGDRSDAELKDSLQLLAKQFSKCGATGKFFKDATH